MIISVFFLWSQSSKSMEIEILPDNLKHIYSFLHESKGAFMATCRAWNHIANDYYDKKNIKLYYFHWNDDVYISSRILNVLNGRFENMLGLHLNISQDRGKNIDRIIFKRLCAKIQDAPFLSKNSFVKSYANLLDEHIDIMTYSVFFQKVLDLFNNIPNKFEKLFSEIGITTSNLNKQINMKFQNELSLFVYYIKFIKLIPMDDRYNIKTINYFSSRLTSSFINTVKNNYKINSLKNVPVLNYQIWKLIIDLDSGSIVSDFRDAAMAHFHAGKFEEATQYFQKFIELVGNSATPEDLRNFAMAHLHAGKFEEAKQYFQKFIELAKYTAQPYEFQDIARAYFHAEKFEESIKYNKLSIKFAEVPQYDKHIIEQANEDHYFEFEL